MDELFLKCPACQNQQRHIILRSKEKGLAIVKCSKCGSLHHAKQSKGAYGVMLVISKNGISSKFFKKFTGRKSLRNGEVLVYNKKRYEIRSIEDKDGGHPEKLTASSARAVYLVPYTKKLSVSVHQKDGKTAVYKIEEPKDNLIKLGDFLRLGKKKVEIVRISSLNGDVKKAKVADILALWGSSP